MTAAAPAPAARRAPAVKAPFNLPAAKLYPDEHPQAQPAPRLKVRHRPLPRRDDYLGEKFQAGDTYYDYQTNGSVGKMIARDSQGGIHVTWMDGYDADNEPRHQKYNFFESGQWLVGEDGGAVDGGTRSGYGSIWLTGDEAQRAMVFYHVEGILDEVISACGIDYGRSWGAFQSALLPRYPEQTAIWPRGVLSGNGLIHVVYNRRDAGYISYTFGTINAQGEPEFIEDSPVPAAPTHLNSYQIARSPNSDRVAITWLTPRTGIPAPPEWDGFLAYQINNDLMLAWSDDGEHWNFDHPLNVTNCIPPNPQEADTVKAMGDTLRPYCTHDLIFDADDNIHIVFDARGLWQKAVYDPDTDRPPIYALTVDAGFLFHWSEETQEVTPVADGWFLQQVGNETGDTLIIWPTPGAWKTNVCNPSLAYDDNGDLFCVFNYYPWGDYNDYVAPGDRSWDIGRCHGDVAVTVSEDNGATWYYPTMVTATASPLAEPGEAMCETYPTLAEDIDDTLHIFYVLDTEGGTKAGQSETGASSTLCPVYYHRLPVGEVRRDSLWLADGLSFHTGPLSAPVDRQPPASDFHLAEPHPNPFNSTAAISYQLSAFSRVNLALYDINGRLVRTLTDGWEAAGAHQRTLRADRLPGGVYILKLSAGAQAAEKKLVLLR